MSQTILRILDHLKSLNQDSDSILVLRAVFMYSLGSKVNNSYTTNFVNKISDRLSVSAYIGTILSVIRILVKSCISAPLEMMASDRDDNLNEI